MRNIPDVAMIASQVLVRYNNGSQTSVAGTSIATPLWAAFVALCNQQAVSAGSPLVGFINPAIYALGQTAGYTTSMHDITTGNNTNSGSPTQFFAVAGYDLCTGWGSPNGSNLINALAPRPSATVISNVSASLVFEGCLPANGAVDPGETVTMSFSLKNVGAIASTNLIATLQADAGVVSPSGPQTYGALVGGGATVSRSFTFTAEGTCGSVLTATLQLQDGPTSLGSIYYNIRLGRSVTNLSQTFDGVSAPALPSGWTSARSGAASNWVTGTAQHDTGINSAFAAEPTNAGIAELTSPSIQITTSSAQLIFRNNYNMETDPTGLSKAYDGGVLEIQIGGGSYSDILTAGGSFVTGGYNGTIDPTDDNALGSRSVWSGLSGGFITTMVNLPASAAGQSIRLKWRFGTDSGNYYGGLGWYIDSVAILDGYTCCNPIADLALTMTGSRNPAGTGQPLTYTLSLANAGPEPAYSISITDSIPNNVTFSTAYPGAYFTNGAVVFPVGTLASGGTTNAFLTVTPLTAASLTNSASAAGVTTDPNLANNGATLITSVAPFIQQITPTATNVALTLNSANGLTYQLEYKNSLAASNWTPVSAPVPGNGAVITLLDTNAPPPPARFYRVRSY
jgi:uncharacterized repeat protein (TIGR01451 family)